MPDYYVQWGICIMADTPTAAAKEALTIQRDPNSIATVFDVFDDQGNCHNEDLQEEE